MSNGTNTPLVRLEAGQPMASSLVVARSFGKNHYDVLRDIRNLMGDLPAEFNARNFAAVEYPDAKGEMRPSYQLTRDAFTLLAMGFTGKRALAWKLKYIAAFNAMEAKLRSLGADGSEALAGASVVPDRRLIELLESENQLLRQKRRRHISPEERAAILDMHRSGIAATEIAAHLERTTSTVRVVLWQARNGKALPPDFNQDRAA